jgi:lipopolysaccharide transport system ATP-binding protein
MTVITVEHVGKKYTIGHQRQDRYLALREVLTHRARGLWQRVRHPLAPNRETTDLEEIWAVEDLNFEITQGERVGIIGRNGAGKSTLLKILSRITPPTTGRVHLKGRVASLLEVGTGFHLELTGRENIYLNGAILGMTRREIKQKFDEIVAFAEVEKFLDTPVKRYSSGMYVRLAFAVAAHLEPEILVVDEVLAVGDTAFQQKCLGKMNEVAQSGRTVLFVSHNMGAIQQLCQRAIFLNEGTIMSDGPAGNVVNEYLTSGMTRGGEKVWHTIEKGTGDEIASLHALRVLDKDAQVCTNFDVRDPVSINVQYWVFQEMPYLDVSLFFFNERGECIFASIDDSADSESGERRRSPGFYSSTCHIPPDFLNNGPIYIQVALTDEVQVHANQLNSVMFHVGDAMDPQGSRRNYCTEWPRTAVRPMFKWNMEKSPLSQTFETLIIKQQTGVSWQRV